MIRTLTPAVVLALTLAGCGSSSTSAPSVSALPPSSSTYHAVCEAARAARAGNTAMARTVFLDRAHQGVHQLAASAAAHDRPAAGRMLEAKERVERDLETKAPASTLTGDLDALAGTARTAIAATGVARPKTCKEILR